MSWTKRSRPSPGHTGAGQSIYNPAQPPHGPPIMPLSQTHNPGIDYQQGYQQPPPSQPTIQQQQQLWSQHHQDRPVQMYNQQNYPPQNYQTNNGNDYFNQYQRTPQNAQNYLPQPQYSQNPLHHPDSGPSQGNWDENEGDPWNWGWEDNSVNQQAHNAALQQPQINANINDSFSNDSWNWQADNALAQHTSDQSQERQQNHQDPEVATVVVSKASSSPFSDNIVPAKSPKAKVLLENIPPQLSTESQDSTISDGPMSNADSHTRSDQPSRNSNQSASSQSTSENVNFNLAPIVAENDRVDQRSQELAVNQDITGRVAAITLDGNRENLTPDAISLLASNSNDSLPPSVPLASTSILQPPQQFSKNATPPPNQRPPPSAEQNPFKRAGPLSHKTTQNRAPINAMSPYDNPPPPMQIPPANQPLQVQRPAIQNLTSPAAVNKVIQQQRTYGNYEPANLEVTPDNSEQPDLSPPLNFRSQPPLPVLQSSVVSQNSVDNLEIIPTNDRNEYLQTGHLSESDYSENFQNVGQPHNTLLPRSDPGFPPPGLRRMVLGQPEVEFNQSANISGDEPPPGLSRMVPGQLTDSEAYNQSSNDYMDRQIDGQNTENDLSNSTNNDSSLQSYRQVEGELTQQTVFSSTAGRNVRRPVGLDRMVPGEPSDYRGQQFASGGEHQRFVTGLEYERISLTPEVREQNVDGSDYTEPQPRIVRQSESGISILDIQGQSTPAEPSIQREVEMEGENLQDLSVVSMPPQSEKKPSVSNLLDSGSEKLGTILHEPSLVKKGRKYVNTSEDSERDRVPKKDKHRPSKDKEGRYSRERDERKSDRRRDDMDPDKNNRDRDRISKDRDRRDKDRDYRDEGDRRYRRSTRDRRYETEDTDYSDRDSRRRREASGKPPYRPDDRDRRYRDEKDRYKSKEDKERGYREYYKDDYESERDRKYRDRDGRDRRYRDDGRSSNYGTLERNRNTSSLRKDRDRNRDLHSSPSRPSSTNKDDDPNKTVVLSSELERPRDRDRRHDRDRRTVDRDRDPHRQRERRDRRERTYGGGQYYGHYQDQYSLQQQQQYEYYENLRRTNPAAYMEFYRNYYAGYNPVPGFVQDPAQADDRGSVHSGMSSNNGQNKNRSLVDGAGYYYQYRSINHSLVGQRDDALFLGDAPSLRTDHSGSRDFNTDMSLQLDLQSDIHTTTVQSDRQTPLKFPTAHIKGSLASTNLVTISPTYPVDGQPAMIEILDLNVLLADDPIRCELTDYPGPLIKDTTHKKTVIEFCEARIRRAVENNATPRTHLAGERPTYQHQISTLSNSSSGSPASQDLASFVLMWELLILLLRQNGRVVGADIAELLMKNKRSFEHKAAVSQRSQPMQQSGSRRNSAVSSSATSRSDQQLPLEEADNGNLNSERTADDTGSHADIEPIDNSLGQDTSQGSVNRNRRLSREKKTTPTLSQSEAVEKFRDYLIFGNVKQALEFAMSYGGVLWAHALQLAPSLDARLRAAVAARFIASLPPADPLATLHALLSSPPRQPRVVTSIADERWGDWRPHLAIILANSSQRRDLDKKAILTLGDSLLSRGSLLAAQFCYLMADVDFGKSPATPFYKSTNVQPTPSRLVLLGMDLSRSDPSTVISNEGIFMTEIYEYACGLSSDNFTLHDFQPFKYILAMRMTDYGLYEKALAYTEIVTNAIVGNATFYEYSFANSVLELADRLKYSDPDLTVGNLAEGGMSPYSVEQPFISQLRQVLAQLQINLGASDASYAFPTPETQQPLQLEQKDDRKNSQGYDAQSWNRPVSFSEPPPPQYFNPAEYQSLIPPEPDQPSQHYQQENQPEMNNPPSVYNPGELSASYAQPAQENFAPDANQYQASAETNPYPENTYWSPDANQSGYGYNEPMKQRDADSPTKTEQNDQSLSNGPFAQPRPTISMPNAAPAGKRQSIFDDEFRDGQRAHRDEQRISSSPSHQQQSQKGKDKKADQPSAKSGPGWFGGIFNKLSLKPKNQMILPDDKNPSIVWDEDSQRWKDKDAAESESSGPAPPPPSMPVPSYNQNPIPSGAPGIPMGLQAFPGTPTPGGNVFKMQKNRNIKKAYVDVFNPGGSSANNANPAAPAPAYQQTAPQPQNFFVPPQDGSRTAQHGVYDQMNY